MAASARAVRIVWPGDGAGGCARALPSPLRRLPWRRIRSRRRSSTRTSSPGRTRRSGWHVPFRPVPARSRSRCFGTRWRPRGARAGSSRQIRPTRPTPGAQLDTQIRQVRRHGLTPIVYIAGAPAWAMQPIDGALRPDPGDYRAFALAAVRRYSGHLAGLPRVGDLAGLERAEQGSRAPVQAGHGLVVPDARERVCRERAQ